MLLPLIELILVFSKTYWDTNMLSEILAYFVLYYNHDNKAQKNFKKHCKILKNPHFGKILTLMEMFRWSSLEVRTKSKFHHKTCKLHFSGMQNLKKQRIDKI